LSIIIKKKVKVRIAKNSVVNTCTPYVLLGTLERLTMCISSKVRMVLVKVGNSGVHSRLKTHLFHKSFPP